MFLIKASFLYVGCFLLHEYVIKKHTHIDQQFIRFIINSCVTILGFFGYKTFESKEVDDYQVFGIDGSNGVWIGGACNGLTLLFLFSVFIIAYPGVIKQKLWFIPLGILIVHFSNLFRIMSLALIALHYPSYLAFNHTYTFTFIVYSIVFGLWMLWVNKIAKPLNS